MHAIISQPPLPPSRLNQSLSAAWDALLLQMLEKAPGLRPAATDVAQVLATLAGDRGANSAVAAAAPVKRHTVGREKELGELRTGFESASAGRGLLLCVAGEPGIGKTTLVEDFLAKLAADGLTFGLARGHCSERLAGAEAYLPFLEALESLLRGENGEWVSRVAPTWYVQIAPLVVEDAALDRVRAEAKVASQERLKREFLAFLQEISGLRPLIIFLEDVHWADPSTTDLLAYIGHKCGGLRVLVVLTYRPTDLMLGKHPLLAVKLELQGRGACREIPVAFLHGLGAQAARRHRGAGRADGGSPAPPRGGPAHPGRPPLPGDRVEDPGSRGRHRPAAPRRLSGRRVTRAGAGGRPSVGRFRSR